VAKKMTFDHPVFGIRNKDFPQPAIFNGLT